MTSVTISHPSGMSSCMQLDTVELISAFRAGDREAFAALVVRFEGLVRTACRRQAPSPEIEDCVQAVFLILERRPAAAARAPALEAWLLRVCCLVCRRAQRASRRRQRAERTVAKCARIATDLAESEALIHLDDCLDELPERQRLAVVMCYLSGYSAAEVAERLKVSDANARQLVSRGLARLRELFARRGVTAGVAGLVAILGQQAQAAESPLTGNLVAALLSSHPSPTATHLSHGVLRTMTMKACIPLLTAIILPGIMTTAYFAAEKTPSVVAADSQTSDIFVADVPGIRLSKAVWDGNDIIVSASYAVPKGTAAEIQFGIDEERTCRSTMASITPRPAPAGRGAFSCRIPGSDRFHTFDQKKPLDISAMLMPSVHEARWSPLASDKVTLDPAWTAKPLTLTWSGTPLDQALLDVTQQSGAVIKLRDPQQRAKAVRISVALKNLPLAEVIDILARTSGARSRLLTTEATGYELSLAPASVSPVTADQKTPVSANDLRIVQARWQGKRLAVEIDYQLKDATGVTLSFGFERLGDKGAVIFDEKSKLSGSPFSGMYLLDPSVLDLSPSDYQRTCSMSAMLMSADNNIFASVEYLIPPQSQCLPVQVDLHEATLAEALKNLGKRGGVKIVLDDPQHHADALLVTLKTPELPLIDALTIIERLTGTIIHGSGATLIVSVPEAALSAETPEASQKSVPKTYPKTVPQTTLPKTEF
jgi:RNA polymerase sigma factor (sigma-70 family)